MKYIKGQHVVDYASYKLAILRYFVVADIIRLKFRNKINLFEKMLNINTICIIKQADKSKPVRIFIEIFII